MSNEIEKQIEMLKRELNLYLILADKLKLTTEERQKQIDLYLDNIGKLLKEKTKKN